MQPRPAAARIDSPRTNRRRRISAHCSTPTTLTLPRLALRGQAQGPQTTGRRVRWSRFQPAQVVQFSPGADNDGRDDPATGAALSTTLQPPSSRAGLRALGC
jgi:hypothetical protein